GVRSGYYHENEQLQAVAPFTKVRQRADDPRTLVATLDEAWAAVHRGRSGPVFLEVPLDVLRAEGASEPWPSLPLLPGPALPRPAEVEDLARLLAGWKRPLLLAGGGAIASGAETVLARLAELLGAPVFHTSMGKGAFPASSPLHAGLPWSRATSDLSNMADCFS